MSSEPTVTFDEVQRQPNEWLAVANDLSERVVKTDARTAWELVRAGKWEGTPFAGKLSQLMFLAGEDAPLPQAAE